MTAYECTGYTMVNGFTVTKWAPAQSDVAKLREYLLTRCGHDYGASDDVLAALAEDAKAYVAATGRRLSWLALARDRLAEAYNPPTARP